MSPESLVTFLNNVGNSPAVPDYKLQVRSTVYYTKFFRLKYLYMLVISDIIIIIDILSNTKCLPVPKLVFTRKAVYILYM